MTVYDSPDWTTLVTTVPRIGVNIDAPDWQRVVVGPGGSPVGGGGGAGSGLTPGDAGYTFWTADPTAAGGGGNTVEEGAVWLMYLPVPTTATVTDVIMSVLPGGSVTWEAGNTVGIYQVATSGPGAVPTFDLVASSADTYIPANWTTTGIQVAPLTAPVKLTTGGAAYYAAIGGCMSNASLPWVATCYNYSNTGGWDAFGADGPILGPCYYLGESTPAPGLPATLTPASTGHEGSAQGFAGNTIWMAFR